MEIEHIDAKALEDVMQDLSIDVEPTPATLRLIQAGSLTVIYHLMLGPEPLSSFANLS